MFLSSFKSGEIGRTVIGGAPEGHDARLLAEAALRQPYKPVLFVAEGDMRAAALEELLAFFAPEIEVLNFPAWDCLPYDRVSPQSEILSRRIETLRLLIAGSAKPRIVLTTVAALAQKVLPPEALGEAGLTLALGAEVPIERLSRFLVAGGFAATGTVREPGEYAVRGGIVDLFPPGSDAPVRLDFFGDEIEAIRLFDPLTQTTTGKIARLDLMPISEVLLGPRTIESFRSAYRALFGAVNDADPLYEAVTSGRKFPGFEHWLGLFYPSLAGLLDYLPGAPVFLDWQVTDALRARGQQIDDFYQARLSLYEAGLRSRKNAKDKNKATSAAAYKPAPVASLYWTEGEVEAALALRPLAVLSPFAALEGGADAKGQRGRNFAEARALEETGLYAAFATFAAEQQGRGRRVLLACMSKGSAERLKGLLRAHGLPALAEASSWEEARGLDIKLITLVVLGVENGFLAPDLALVSEQDLLGDRLARPQRKKRQAAAFQIELGSLAPGDFVVHAEHGIGRYEGLETIEALGTRHDCVRLVYDGGDKLFVPVENLDVLTRYASAEAGAALDKLGGAAWQGRKARVKKRLKDMADALLKIAAERELKTGELIEVPETTYEEFASRFPYPETDDQARAIGDVIADLGSGKPMDRLVCGDVGFGKTEVALRAAFAAVSAGLQVALVVPTTLLARQHVNLFEQRFKGFPVRIAQLSRMVPVAEARQAKEAARAGQVDILIGTHALLAKDVGFKSLGLLIIDEEQHFGVKQKERMKELRADVHVLTLTATPIPRTLQLALAGVRELSLIATPPVDRLAVRTFILPYDPVVIREALMREHYRGGQSFYVCPRIEDLADVTRALTELVPEVKVVTAHGRMSPTELDDIMTAFDAGKFDVLLATNIIESGIDIPSANTMVIHRSDLFGLAQLYQLRGRVGRGKLRGYAYLTYAANAPISATALQRLEVLQTLDQLGAGFELASHDMDIRGAGNLLGEEQSGHIREVGVELYQQMLEDAVAAAKAGGLELPSETRHATPQINIGMSVLIPETYVADLGVRLGLYRRLADGAEGEEIEALAAEMIDRFGPLPREVDNLLATVAIKQLCRQAGVARIDAGPKGAVIGFWNDVFAEPARLIAWISSQAGTVKVRPDQKLVLLRVWDSPEARLTGVRKVLEELAALAKKG